MYKLVLKIIVSLVIICIGYFDITDKAESNAQIFLDKWVRTFGFKSVKISVK